MLTLEAKIQIKAVLLGPVGTKEDDRWGLRILKSFAGILQTTTARAVRRTVALISRIRRRNFP